MSQEQHCYLNTAVGWLRIAADEVGISSISFIEQPPKVVPQVSHPHLKEAYRQLGEYFKGERVRFNLPLNPKGTEFQRAVWQGLTEIPFGTTTTYGQLAAKVGKPGGARAVGMANNKNPLPIVVPCHRVIGADGSLVGFAPGLDYKVKLLELEGAL